MTDHAILDARVHGDLRVRRDRGAALGDAVMCCMAMPDEFRRLQNEYPILFRLDLTREAFTAFAMFGFEDGENLFLDGDRWDARYVPLAIDTQPFLIGRSRDGDRPGQVHVDLASPRLARDRGERLFDDDARPTTMLEGVADKLGQLDAAYRASHDFLAALRRYDLLEPAVVEVGLADGAVSRLVGFHVIAEERLRALDADAIADLAAADHLMPIYMALASLSNIPALVDRRNARMADADR